MAVTYWVDGVSGNDGNAGTSFAAAFATVGAAVTAVDGEADTDITVNVVNTTSYEMSGTTGADVAFDCTTSHDVVWQGTDSSGTPALTTITAPATGASYFISARTVNSCTVQYFDVNWNASKASATTQSFIGYSESGNQGTVEVRFCRVRGTTDGTMPAGARRILTPYGALERTNLKSIHHCVIEYVTDWHNAGSGTSCNVAFYDNVVILSSTGQISDQLVTGLAAATTGSSFGFYSNTIWFYHVFNGTIPDLVRLAPTSGTDGTLNIYDNVVWLDGDGDGGSVTLANGIFRDSVNTESPTAGTRGYNVFYTSTALTDANVTGYVVGSYMAKDDTKGYLTDSVTNETTAATLFVDPTTSYSWTPTGSAVALTVSKDLRLITELTSGNGGALPGALPVGNTDYTLSSTTTTNYPTEGEVVTVSITVSNSGANATALILDCAVPSGLTLVSATPTQGTYNSTSGLWTVGALADAASATIVFITTVDTGVGGTTITFSGSIDSSTPQAGGDTSDDTTSQALVVKDETDVTDPDASGRAPYIDSLPVTQPITVLDINSKLRTRRNRLEENYLRSDKENIEWSEYRSMRIVVGTSSSVSVNLGGIERASYLMVESDSPVSVSLDGTNYGPAALLTAIVDGDFESLNIQNSSSTTAANVLLLVVD